MKKPLGLSNKTETSLPKTVFTLICEPVNLWFALLFACFLCLNTVKGENAPAARFISSDGTLNKKALQGHNLSLDIKGWNVALDPKKGPVLTAAPPPSGTWSALDKGLNNNVYSIAVLGTDVYVGGEFTDVASGGTPVAGLNNIAKWNGTNWSALDKGLNDGVFYLTVLGTDIYVGGLFTDIGTGGTPVSGLSRVAKWNGTAWSALDKGLNNSVSWIEKQGTDLYMTGDFTDVGAGGTPVSGLNHIAKWNGTTWSALDKGLDDSAFAIAVSGSDVYVGGIFKNVGSGGTAVVGLNNIAKWNGTAWSSLDNGFDNSVFAIALKGTEVYAVGAFTSGRVGTLNHVAKWDGTTWASLENGINGTGTCVSVIGSDIYVGGYFTNTGLGGTPTSGLNMIAKWDGTTWSTLDYGLNYYVWAIVPVANNLYVGGQFLGVPVGGTYVGGLNAMAKWTLPCLEPTKFTLTGGGSYCVGSSGVAVGLSNSEVGVDYQLKNNGNNVGLAMAGTGSPLSFGTQTAVGTYSVEATKTSDGCATSMLGDKTISIASSSTPSVYIQANPLVLGLCAGNPITLKAVPENGGTPTYQWRKNGAAISGETGATFTSSTLSNGDVITIVMTSNAPCITTPTAVSPPTTITIKPAPTVNAVANQTVSAGSSTAAITFTGTGATSYTWTNDNTATGLAASGTGNIAAFTATNNTSAAITSTVTVTPVSGSLGLGYAYITNTGSNTVSVINTSTNTVVTTVTVGSGPQGVSVSPDGSRVYIANFSSNTVSVINTSTNAVVATIGVGSSPTGVVVSPDGSRLYVANRYSDNANIINTSTNTVVATVGVGANPGGVSVSPDGSRLYVTNRGSNNVSVINTSTNTVVATVPVGNYPLGISLSPDGSRLYVTSRDFNNVSVINTSTNTVLTTVTVGSGPICLSISPDGSRVFVSNFDSDNVSVINTSTNAVVATIAVGSNPSGVSFSPDGSRAYIANFNSNTVSVINTSTNTVEATVAVGSSPIAFGNFIKADVPTCTGTPTTFTLTVNAIPSVSIAITTGSTTICTGTSVTFTATPTNGGTPTYVWRKNGNPISGQTGATYTTIDLANSDVITCVMTSSLATISPKTATSAGISMVVNPMLTPSVSIASNQAGAICAGSSATFTATPLNGGSPTYQWRKNGGTISGETAANFTSSTLANGDVITVVMTSNAACISTPTATSSGVTMSVKALPTVNTIPNQTVCDGLNTTPIAFTGAIAGTRFDWTNSLSSIGLGGSGTGTISAFGAVNASLSPVNALISVTPTYTNSGLTCTGVPNSFSIIVNPRPTPVTVLATQNAVCAGTPNTLSYTGGTSSNTLFAENFNAPLTNWTRINNSTGGNVASAAWTQRPNGYYYREYFNTPDASGFYMSNSDAQGSGTTTNTITTTQAISTIGFTNMTINLSHYYRSWGGQTGKVQLSKDGNTWTDVIVYASTRGSASSFVTDNITIPPTFENQTAVYLRFQFESYYGWYWAINDVSTTGTATTATNLAWSATPAGFTSALPNPTANPTVNTNYKVSVTNNFGCSRTGALDVTVKPLPTFTITPTNIACSSGGSNGAIQIVANVGTALFYFSKDDGVTYTAGLASPYSFTNLPIGTYKIKIKDANGCESVAKDVAIAEPPPLSITPSTPTGILCAGGLSTISASASGGMTTPSKPYQFSMDGGAFQVSSSFSANAGTHRITVKDANGCETTSSSITVAQPTPLSIDARPNVIFCSGSETTINVTASGGTTTPIKPYQYSLNGGVFQNNSAFTVRAGAYVITVKDANGCTASTAPLAIADGVPLITCPQPIRIECGQLTEDGKALPSVTGQLNVTGVCLTANQISFTDIEYNMDCGTLVSSSNGTTTLPFNPNFAIDAKKVLVRRFAVNAASVVSYACYQSIYIVPNKLTDIVFPADITLTCANNRTAPSDTAINHLIVKGTGEPTLNNQTYNRTFCDNFKTTFTDVRTTTATGLSIQRTWVIKADCGNNSRTKVQTITVPTCTVSNISGTISRENGTEIPAATQLSNIETGTKLTETGVNFAFRNIARNSRLQLRPTRPNTDWTNGVTVLDVSLLSRHLLDIAPINSPYNLISADVNADGGLDAADMLLMQRLILRIIPAFPNNNSWRFVYKNFTFPRQDNPFSADFPEILSIPNLTEAISNADFVAIKVGDINQSAGSINIRGGAKPFKLLVEDKVLEKGKTYEIPIEMPPSVLALQFTLNVDKNAAKIEGITKGDLPNFTDNNTGLFQKEGIVTAAWQQKSGQIRSETEKLTMMTLTLKPTSNTRLSEILSVNSLYTEGVAYDTKGNGLPVELSFSNPKSVSDKAVLLPNRPNPFSDETTLSFTLPEASKAKLTVCDLLGKVLMTTERMFNGGLNEVVFDATSTPSVANGIFIVRLQTATGVLEQKIVLSR
jgi:YVTN family beta-propeller protein